ncbi:MAG: hypothetical protein V5A30_00820 [Haloarculaceae archaeon]
MRDRPLLAMFVVALVVVGAAGLVALAAPVGAQAADGSGSNGSATDGSGSNGSAEDAVSVTAGAQLSTVLSVTSDDVHSEVEETAFEVEYERGEGRAEAVAERAEAVRERAADVREDYREALEAYREGDLDRSEFARRLAALNARAGNVLEAHGRLERRAATLSALDLRVAGFNRTALTRAVASLDDVRGTGTSALLAQFTGQRRGAVELQTNGGLSIQVRSEDGERSREFEHGQDGDTAVTVNQSVALETARGALTDVENGSWVLTDAGVDGEDGTYEFAFALRADGQTGEAEVGIDGSSGQVFSLEEEVEPADDSEGEPGTGDADNESDEPEDGERVDELVLVVTDGQPAPNATVTVRAFADGQAVANASVAVDGEAVGKTAADGTLTLTLPDAGDVTLAAERGEAEAELEFAFGDDEKREEEAFQRNVDVSAVLADGTVTVTATYNGSGIPDATVSANGERVGTTDAGGTLSFALPADAEELDLELTKGSFETESEYDVRNGSLAPPEGDDEREDRAGEQDDTTDDSVTEDEATDDGETESLELAVDGGDPGPGETVSLRVFADGDPAADTTVLVNDERAGTTDDDGRVTVTLPDADDVEITAETDDARAELAFEFDDQETETETRTETETDDDDTDG